MSSLLNADDLNDFIVPGVACIKTEEDKADEKEHIELEFESSNDVGEVIEIDNKGNRNKLKKAQISLTDCLACSGCITSAEEVLVAKHNYKEFINVWKKGEKEKYVLSLSQQTRASLAMAFNVDMQVLDVALGLIFKEKFGFEYIVSVGVGRKISIKEINKEIETRKTMEGPLLSSICPGFVLYIEKTNPFLVKNMSQVKSPQGITGGIVKRMIADETGTSGEKIYHLSVMPCFDKKLEAEREEGLVDCVITPREIVLMFEEVNIDIGEYFDKSRELLDAEGYVGVIRRWAPASWFAGNLYGWGDEEGSSSGGYAYQYLKQYQEDHVQSHANTEIRTVNGRNRDIYELRLVDAETGVVLCRGGVINGFKNIQNVVRKMKLKEGTSTSRPKSSGLLARRRRKAASAPAGAAGGEELDITQCDFIEVMACPKGCINGGGQIQRDEHEFSEHDWDAAIHDKYTSTGLDAHAGLDAWINDTLVRQLHVDYPGLIDAHVKSLAGSQHEPDPLAMFTSTW